MCKEGGGVPGNNIKNLRPQNTRTKNEQRKIAKKGGIASGAARREQSTARKAAKMALFGKAPEKVINTLGLEKDADIMAAMMGGQALAAIKGNTAAFNALIDLVDDGEKSDGENKTVKYTGLPAVLLGKSFVDVYRDMLARKYTDFDFEGGRGSLKSTTCGLFVVDQIERNPQFCALLITQLKEQLHDSVYSQIQWAIDELELSDDYIFTKSPMIITKISTGQKIYFRGGDQPKKIKSIKPPSGKHIGVVWIEEADQLRGEDALRDIKQSAFRGGNEGLLFRSYNVPRSQLHFINREKLKDNPKRLIHHSHYMDAPPEWLGKRFYDDAELLKTTNLTAYRHEYDGEAVGSGGAVFENITDRVITDAEIKSFDRILNGIDWGWYPDPWAFMRVYFHAGTRTLYIFDEVVKQKAGNRETVEILKKKGLTGADRIVCDGAEPKSIADYREFGLLKSAAAVKGPGSVDYSMKWLASLTAIVIDKKRCPAAFSEFTAYEYERDKHGNIISGYPDKDNHCIDAVRYATEDIWRRRETKREYI